MGELRAAAPMRTSFWRGGGVSFVRFGRGGGAYGVAVYIFRDGVDYDVCAVVKGVLDIGAEEGIVDHDRDAVLVGDCCDISDVDEAQCWITGAFDPDELCLLGPDEFSKVGFNSW